MLKADDLPEMVMQLNANDTTESYANYCAITNQDIQLPADNFAVQTKLGWMSATEYSRLKLSDGVTNVFTPLGSKEFRLMLLTDSTRTTYDEMKARIVVFQDRKPKYRFDFNRFKGFDADWIDERVLKIVSWPGSRVRVTELVNVETGKIIYRSADGIYENPEPQSSAVKNKDTP